MYARDFNSQVESVLWPILQPVGFSKVRKSFVFERENGQIVLLRSRDKWSALCQYTRYVLCFRHTFLGNLFEEVPVELPSEPNSFPFRIQPTLLGKLNIDAWKYSFQLIEDRFDRVEFGQMADCSSILQEIGEAVVKKGLLWAERLTPHEALHQLETNGSQAFCEQVWIDDYRRWLQTNQ